MTASSPQGQGFKSPQGHGFSYRRGQGFMPPQRPLQPGAQQLNPAIHITPCRRWLRQGGASAWGCKPAGFRRSRRR
jgi:hypothetical protein